MKGNQVRKFRTNTETVADMQPRFGDGHHGNPSKFEEGAG
jgi:hypothetical protein